jgi:flagellar protein FlbD
MIQLTRLNNSRLAVNSDLIKCVEEAPDTVITLLSGDKLVVRETTAQVIERVRDFRRSVLIGNSSAASSTLELNLHSGDSASLLAGNAEEPDRG